jgi:hypothetical protein
MHTLVNPRRTAPTGWIDSPDALPSRALTGINTIPIGVRAPTLGPLALVKGIDFHHEYARALAKPHLYDEDDIAHMHEMHLAINNLTEWDCGTCGQWNQTPDDEFTSASPCAFCCPIPAHTEES